MTFPYTTISHHFGDCTVESVHRKWVPRDEVQIHLERRSSGGRRGDEVDFHVSSSDAKTLCKGLLNIIGNDNAFHGELEHMMQVQRTPE